MINDAIDFDYAINQIIKNTSPTVHLQADVLSSENMNNSFEEIENTLNTLYEKTRYLEDAIAYTKTFLETRISDFNNQISSVLHEIENTVDAAKNLSYISYNVPFVENKRSIIDRDGVTSLSPLIIKNKNLTLDYLLDENKKYNIWTRVTDSIPYKDNINKIASENYRTIYLEEKLKSEGMKETIYTYFEEPTLVNDLNIEPVNCVVQNLRFGLINGLEDVIEFYDMDMPIAPRVCTYIKFDLVCTNYDYNVYTLDKSLLTDNIWSKLQEFEYGQIMNLGTKLEASQAREEIIPQTKNLISLMPGVLPYMTYDFLYDALGDLQNYDPYEIYESMYETNKYINKDTKTGTCMYCGKEDDLINMSIGYDSANCKECGSKCSSCGQKTVELHASNCYCVNKNCSSYTDKDALLNGYEIIFDPNKTSELMSEGRCPNCGKFLKELKSNEYYCVNNKCISCADSVKNSMANNKSSIVLNKTTINSSSGKKETITYSSIDNKKTTTLKMYSYIFGIDKFEIKNSEHYTDGYMISDPITIGQLKDNEYIRLDVKHHKNDCCEISYSILDGDREIPIAIMNEDRIENELVFNNVDTRFEMDFGPSPDFVSEVIKKNGLAIDTNYIDAKDQSGQSNDRFCVSYSPSVDCYDYKPINKTIRVKCYIRTYGNVDKVPYISNITIRKYGEESLWINRF